MPNIDFTISIDVENGEFTFSRNGWEKVFTFQEILDSEAWQERKIVALEHPVKNYYGTYNIDVLSRDCFLDRITNNKVQDIEDDGVKDLNENIFKLFSILDQLDAEESIDEQSIDDGIANIYAQRNALDDEKEEYKQNYFANIQEKRAALANAFDEFKNYESTYVGLLNEYNQIVQEYNDWQAIPLENRYPDWQEHADEYVTKIASKNDEVDTANSAMQEKLELYNTAVQNLKDAEEETEEFSISKEMKKMIYAVRDEEVPQITLQNVTKALVKQYYDDHGKPINI